MLHGVVWVHASRRLNRRSTQDFNPVSSLTLQDIAVDKLDTVKPEILALH